MDQHRRAFSSYSESDESLDCNLLNLYITVEIGIIEFSSY